MFPWKLPAIRTYSKGQQRGKDGERVGMRNEIKGESQNEIFKKLKNKEKGKVKLKNKKKGKSESCLEQCIHIFIFFQLSGPPCVHICSIKISQQFFLKQSVFRSYLHHYVTT